MSLYGALFSGVSGLNSQSNKIGIISDNISNVNTIGYKGNSAGFESLVTSAASAAAFSPGGVLGATNQLVSKQGLLQSTNSATDVAVSGDGFFVVNQAADQSGQVLYTRAGSFSPDSTGNFKNSAGFFLQAWPLDRDGRLPGEPGNLNTISNANLTSLKTVNVQNLTGVAASTSSVSIGANLNAATVNYPGAAGKAKFDSANRVNFGITAKDLITPDSLSLSVPVNRIERGDKFTVSTGSGLSYTYRYGGFTYGRDVTTATNLGDNGATLQAGSSTIGPQGPIAAGTAPSPTGAAPLQIISKTGSGPYTSVVRVTSASHGLVNGDAITLGSVPAFDNYLASELNTTFKISNVTANTYDITVTSVGNPTLTTTGGGTNVITSTVQPFSTTSGQKTVQVRDVAHGLQNGDVVNISSVSGSVGGVSATDLNTKFVVTVVDANHYTISVANNASADTGGGNSGISVIKRAFTGSILDATDPDKTFISGDPGSGHNFNDFSATARTFSISTGANSYTFTYTQTTPTPALGQFNNLNTLAAAINNVSTLSARVVNNRLFVGAVDANAAISFANGTTVGTGSGASTLAGIDWVRELGLSNQGVGTDRFNSLKSLSTLVNNSSGVSATIDSETGPATLTINVDDPLDTITFADKAAPVPTSITLPNTPFQMVANSGVVTITTTGQHGYSNGDIIDLGTVTGGPYNGISAADLSGKFTITVVTPTTFTIVAKNSAVASASVTNPVGPAAQTLLQPVNSGNLVMELGLVAHSPFGSGFTPRSSGSIGPAYDPTNSAKNMASGAIAAQFSRTVQVFDSLGTGHTLTLAAIKTASNTWALEIYSSPASDVTSPLPNGQLASGSITFNGDSTLRSISSVLTQPINIVWNNGASSSNITFNLGTAGQQFGTPGATTIGKADGFSQFDSANKVNFVNQNGAPVGDLLGVVIDKDGYVVASFNNGNTQKLFRVPLAKFSNPDELQSISGNVYAQSSASGEVNLRQSGSSGVGKITPSSLEQSSVELAGELTDMIVAQRSYQANTKVIQTASTLLEDLSNIIR